MSPPSILVAADHAAGGRGTAATATGLSPTSLASAMPLDSGHFGAQLADGVFSEPQQVLFPGESRLTQVMESVQWDLWYDWWDICHGR
jgi:hypothetical protein